MITFNYEDFTKAIKEQYYAHNSDPIETLEHAIYEVGSLGFDLVLSRKFKRNPRKEFFIIIPEVLEGLKSEYVRVLVESSNGQERLSEDNNYLLHNVDNKFITISKVSEEKIKAIFGIE